MGEGKGGSGSTKKSTEDADFTCSATSAGGCWLFAALQPTQFTHASLLTYAAAWRCTGAVIWFCCYDEGRREVRWGDSLVAKGLGF